MHPYRGIVSTYILSDGISTKTDDQNTLILQYADTNDPPRDPLHGPVTWNLARTRPYSTSTAIYTTPCISATVTTTASTALLRQETAHHHINYPMLYPLLESAVSLVTVFDLIRLTIFDLIRLNWGFNLIRLNCGFNLTRLTFFPDSI